MHAIGCQKDQLKHIRMSLVKLPAPHRILHHFSPFHGLCGLDVWLCTAICTGFLLQKPGNHFVDLALIVKAYLGPPSEDSNPWAGFKKDFTVGIHHVFKKGKPLVRYKTPCKVANSSNERYQSSVHSR